jgi:hypothetical protein
MHAAGLDRKIYFTAQKLHTATAGVVVGLHVLVSVLRLGEKREERRSRESRESWERKNEKGGCMEKSIHTFHTSHTSHTMSL